MAPRCYISTASCFTTAAAAWRCAHFAMTVAKYSTEVWFSEPWIT